MGDRGLDIDIEVNPYECGQGWQVDLTKDDFIGKEALAQIKQNGVTHKLAGLLVGGEPITWYAADFYHVLSKDELVGYVTSAWYSPTQKSNIALAMPPVDLTNWHRARGGIADQIFEHTDCSSQS